MDRLPLTRATTLIFIENFPMVYPSHSLSNKQKCEICNQKGLKKNFAILLMSAVLVADKCLALFVQNAKMNQLSFLFLSLLLIPSSTLPLLFLQVDVDVDVDVLVLGLVLARLASTGESPLLSFLLLSNCLHSSTPAPAPAPAPAPIFAFWSF